MNIQHIQDEGNGEFFLLDEQGNKIAELTYFFENENTINANHTYVSDKLRGQGVAARLYLALVEFVEQNQLNLIPSCSYIAKKWEKENR
ncbi:hypothetical protein EV697_10916 [Bisgaardia hudsonensis]|uniref:N-acetyltransferase domain-containing protein n=1 Tax=Bisgaardia hudsonensis TaxID=109472 RepID=A0A4R2MST7_9PAST|nr:GNAT family N-acetyltransferase [Bisgaardia hudsonensis]QLB13542.1 acetyltransferase [Bisgaardia hudsonensis]TCP11166.1 hypothetical protein EV697_10916 [Bisgaardia hudsonensis]